MKENIIQQGAEAVIILKGDSIMKKRVRKEYRIEHLDEKIRKLRTRSEGKLLKKASDVISVPQVHKVDEKSKEIIMEFIHGKKLSDYLDKFSAKRQEKICEIMGCEIAKLHNHDMIHGDLTTSNMILVESEGSKKPKVYFIDFGLGYHSMKIEDKAVDLHLLKQALEARHFKIWKILFDRVTKGYKSVNEKESKKILERLKSVERRGRYKEKY